MGAVALFMLLVSIFTVMTHWADCIFFFPLLDPKCWWCFDLTTREVSEGTDWSCKGIPPLLIVEGSLLSRLWTWMLLSFGMQHSGWWSDRSLCFFLVPLGLLVSDQRIQFVEINDGSQSSVSNKVMGTDAGRARKGARHRQRDGWTQTDSVNTRWVWCLVSAAVSSCIIQFYLFFVFLFSFSVKNKDVDSSITWSITSSENEIKAHFFVLLEVTPQPEMLQVFAWEMPVVTSQRIERHMWHWELQLFL